MMYGVTFCDRNIDLVCGQIGLCGNYGERCNEKNNEKRKLIGIPSRREDPEIG